MSRYIRIITALMLIMSVMVLSGCGGNNDSEKADPSEEVQTEEQDTASQ